MVDVRVKPCPFCGGEAIICGNNEYNNRTWVMCKACHACPGGDVPSLAVAVAAWNRRSTLSDAVAECEAEPVGRSGDAQDIANRLRRFFNQPGDARRLALDAAMMIEYLNKPSPPTSELEALRKRVAELEKAELEPETAKARAAAVICEVGALCGWPNPECKSREAAEALYEARLLASRCVREGGKVE